MDCLTASNSVHTETLLPPEQQWPVKSGRRLIRVRSSAPILHTSNTLDTKCPVLGDASNKLNCRSEKTCTSQQQYQGWENCAPYELSQKTNLNSIKRTVITSGRTTSWDGHAQFALLGSISNCDDTNENNIQICASDSTSHLVTSRVTRAPLQALLTAPTKFKPQSSRHSNATALFGSKSRLSQGSPATPKRARGPFNGHCPQAAPSPCSPTTNLKMLTKVASLDVQLQQTAKKSLSYQDRSSVHSLGEKNNSGKRPLPTSSSDHNGESCDLECTEQTTLLDGELDTESEVTAHSPNVIVTSSVARTSLRGHGSEIVSSQEVVSADTGDTCSPLECQATKVRKSVLVSSTPSTAASLKRPFSSYCSSLDPDDRLEETPLISPAPFTGEVFTTTSDFSSHNHFNFNHHFSLDGKQNPQLSITSACDSSFAVEMNSSKSMRQRQDSEQSLSSGFISSSQKSIDSNSNLSRNDSSTALAINVTGNSTDTLGVADYSSVVLHKLPSEISRRDKSLGLLGERFLEVFPLDMSVPTSPRRLVLDEVAAQLNTERRRIYDIVNVLESLNMANKVGKNVYQWSGSEHLLDTLARLKALGNSLGLPRLMVALQDHGTSFRFPAVSAAISNGAAVDTRREKSLGIICQKLLMLLLAAPQPKIISMEAAVQVIVCGDSDQSPSVTNKASGTGTNRRAGSSVGFNAMSRTVSENRTVPLPRLPSRSENWSSSSLCRSNSALSDAGDSVCTDTSYLQSPSFSDMQESGRASKACGAGQQQRARGRRMYDIANVLSALGLVARLPASRSLQYVGPLDLPTLDLQQDEDMFSSCQRQSLLRCRHPSEGTGHTKPGSGATGSPTPRPTGSVRGMTAPHNGRSAQQNLQHTSTNHHQVKSQVNTTVPKSSYMQYSPVLDYSILRDPACSDGKNSECRSSLPCSSNCSPIPVVLTTGAPLSSVAAGIHESPVFSDGRTRNNSESTMTRTLSNKTSSLLEVAELELQRLLAEEREVEEREAKEREAKEREDNERQERLKRLHYLVSPGYCQELQARRSIPAPRAGHVVAKVSDGPFAVPTGTAPRSPLILTRAMPMVLVKGTAPVHKLGRPQPAQSPGVTGQQRSLHTGQQRAQNIIVLKGPQHNTQQRHPVPPQARGQQQQATCPLPSPTNYVKPVQRPSLFHNMDRAKIITLSKAHSFRILPQLRSPRIALSFPEGPANGTLDANEGDLTNEGPLQPINLSLKQSSEAQRQVI